MSVIPTDITGLSDRRKKDYFVNKEAINNSSLGQAITELIQSNQNIELQTANLDAQVQSGINKSTALDQVIDAIDSNNTIVCEAQAGTLESGTGWRIKKIIVNGAITKIKYANGDAGFNFIADNRLTYTY